MIIYTFVNDSALTVLSFFDVNNHSVWNRQIKIIYIFQFECYNMIDTKSLQKH